MANLEQTVDKAYTYTRVAIAAVALIPGWGATEALGLGLDILYKNLE